MIPDDVVERVRDEADIVSIVGEFVKLKRVGNSFRGPCPFHHGKNDNFSVTTKGGYKCFRCGEAGRRLHVRAKAPRARFRRGREMGRRQGRGRSARGREADRRARPARAAVGGERDRSSTSSRSSSGRVRRGKSRATISRRGPCRARTPSVSRSATRRATPAPCATRSRALGFDEAAAARGEAARDERGSAGAAPALSATGSCSRSSTPSGHVVGFGGRILGDGEPEVSQLVGIASLLQGTLLYGLNWAKQAIRKADRLIVVEGYFDAIRLMLAGIAEVVAPLGTALTEQQAHADRKYTKNVFLLYDSDQAGLKATFSAGDVLLANGIAVRVISLPEGDDPDTFVAKAGAEGFERAAAASVDVFDRKIQILERGGWFADLRRKRQAIDQPVADDSRHLRPRHARSLHFANERSRPASRATMLIAELEAAPRQRRGPPSRTSAAAGSCDRRIRVSSTRRCRRSGERRRDYRGLGRRAERELIRMLLHQRRYVETVGRTTWRRELWRFAVSCAFSLQLTAHDQDVPLDELAASLDEEATAVLQELMNETGGLDRVQETVDASINALLVARRSPTE